MQHPSPKRQCNHCCCFAPDSLPVHTDSSGSYCKIPLTQNRFAKVDQADYVWLSQFKWHLRVNTHAAYAVRVITESNKSKRIYMHRQILNTPPHLVCDHINHNGLDNRRINLRNCTIKQNNANSRSAKNSSSKFKGVSWNKTKKKWTASIKADNKQTHLGYFKDETDAALAYDQAAKKLHGQFAALNFK